MKKVANAARIENSKDRMPGAESKTATHRNPKATLATIDDCRQGKKKANCGQIT